MGVSAPINPKYWTLEWADIPGVEKPPFALDPSETEIAQLAKEGLKELGYLEQEEGYLDQEDTD